MSGRSKEGDLPPDPPPVALPLNLLQFSLKKDLKKKNAFTINRKEEHTYQI